MGRPSDLDRLQAHEAADPVVFVHYVVTLAEVAEAGKLDTGERTADRGRLVAPREDQGVRK